MNMQDAHIIYFYYLITCAYPTIFLTHAYPLRVEFIYYGIEYRHYLVISITDLFSQISLDTITFFLFFKEKLA